MFEILDRIAFLAHKDGKNYFSGEFFAGQALDINLVTSPEEARNIARGFYNNPTNFPDDKFYKLGERLSNKWRD